ncbi:aminoacyl-tRNA deacylase [Mycobacterium parmense]|uniref:Cys-tRNA(Pro)/Cys-tRNA(Cys) deacylase n=1 Tax=Mycobacterium parmense TaxID=185642 RepID=A0A7I7YXM3_9MYCO|nr:aminoacyl-tRNA deacylase [Mycobacterium parmense]MCV7351068.1 aminoacyl-tRNA deacylase [Mycobacterium parmense]ORW60637.1 aminoacyl-tRNA deacylase [Mycobacterium parmense]BBZ45491.1 Cys-tRNA(Pro)/Cys-tRNA(Cys) deacylase [Mycobacterium parmense]
MTGAATPALAALVAAGVPHEILRYDHDAGRRSFGAEAIDELTRAGRIAPEQIFKTLVLAVPGGLAVAVVQASGRLSLKATAAALGVAKAGMAEPAAAERATGYVLGAVSPFGQRKPLPTVVDAEALSWNRVYCSAGRRGWEVGVSPRDLVRITGAVAAQIRT